MLLDFFISQYAVGEEQSVSMDVRLPGVWTCSQESIQGNENHYKVDVARQPEWHLVWFPWFVLGSVTWLYRWMYLMYWPQAVVNMPIWHYSGGYIYAM